MKRYTLIIVAIIIASACSTFLYKYGKYAAYASFIHTSVKTPCKILVCIESGHSGIDHNQYLTYGKQSPQWSDGLKIYEGYSCKLLAYDLCSSLLASDIEAVIINPAATDMPLLERTSMVNNLFKLDNRVIFISLHHNAQPTDHADYTDRYGVKGYLTGGATGIEIYTSPNQTRSDQIATLIYDSLKTALPNIQYRTDFSDGDPDKEANFYVLTKTNCPAILIEFMFMTTYSDCLVIASEHSRTNYIKAITAAIKSYNNAIQ